MVKFIIKSISLCFSFYKTPLFQCSEASISKVEARSGTESGGF